MMNVKKHEYTPISGRSASRYAMFKLCKRQYYYNYYMEYDKEIPFSHRLITKRGMLTSITAIYILNDKILSTILLCTTAAQNGVLFAYH